MASLVNFSKQLRTYIQDAQGILTLDNKETTQFKEWTNGLSRRFIREGVQVTSRKDAQRWS